MDINSDDDDMDSRSNPGDEPSEPDKPSPYTLNKRGIHDFARKNKISLDPKVIDDILGPNKKKTWSSEAAAVNYMKYVQEAKKAKEAAEEVARAEEGEAARAAILHEKRSEAMKEAGERQRLLLRSGKTKFPIGGGNKKRRTKKRRTKKRRTKKRRTKKRRTKKR